MRALSRELRLPINDFGYFRQHGRWHRITRRGWETLNLLADLYRVYLDGEDHRSLLRVRDVIRCLDSRGSAACLNFVIRRTKLGSLRLLAIWIRGRIGGTLGTCRLASFANYPDAKVRKEVARTWGRMSAWKQLTQMVHNEQLRDDVSQRVVRMATIQAVRPFDDRLGNALQIFHSHGEPARRPPEFFVAEGLEIRHGTLPKSASVIERILLRIRSLVRHSPFAQRR